MSTLARIVFPLALVFLALAPAAYADTGADPAGGAAITDVLVATGGAVVMTALLFYVGFLHRSGRLRALERLSASAERRWGLPGWSALPGLVATASLLVALLGMYWDISLHIDNGRDAGPLANPAHFLILFGLGGVFAAGFLSMVLARERPSPTAVRLTRGWYAPLGGVLLFACAGFSLLGFPLDDAWHRLFGQDVTLWGPTHLMLFGGAALTLVGRAVLLGEGARALKAKGTPDARPPWIARLERGFLIGGLLIGLSTVQGEFDFGVPQFQLVFQPALIMVAAGIALVTARIWAGRGGALLAVALFVGIRGVVSLLVGPVFGQTVPHFPLYFAEAVLVELLALRLSAEKRPLAFGAVAGALIGTVGLAAEWGWSHLWMPLPWPSSLLAEAAIVGPLMAIAGGVLGALIGSALASDRLPLPRRAGWAVAAASVVIAGVVAYGLRETSAPELRAQVTTTEVRSGPQREVSARVVITPRTATHDAKWVAISDWQGGGLVVDRLRRVDDGVYETTQPIPAHDGWKSILRVHKDRWLAGVPLYMPADAAIPAPAVPIRPRVVRSFRDEKFLFQREAKVDPGPVSGFAYAGVLALALAILAGLGVGLRRYALAGEAAGRRPPGPRDALPSVRATPALSP
jgi:hypothetical protein